uniref:Uncharacterized protein n=1 Tax=Cacopsylla melanoneura TaxID=428564 RepID=A0A8D8QUP8_9HEMI
MLNNDQSTSSTDSQSHSVPTANQIDFYIDSFLLFHGFIFLKVATIRRAVFSSFRTCATDQTDGLNWRNFQSRLHEIKITNNQLEEHVSSFKPRVVLKRVGISDASRVGLPRLFCKRVRVFFVARTGFGWFYLV